MEPQLSESRQCRWSRPMPMEPMRTIGAATQRFQPPRTPAGFGWTWSLAFAKLALSPLIPGYVYGVVQLECRLISLDERLLLRFPVQALLNPPPSGFPQLLAKLFRIEQLNHLICKINGIVGNGIECCRTCHASPLLQVEEHHRQAERHVFENLYHGQLVVEFIFGIRGNAQIRVREVGSDFTVRNLAGEGYVFTKALAVNDRLQVFKNRPAPNKNEMSVLPVFVLNDVLNGFEEQIHTVLCAHETYVGHKQSLTALVVSDDLRAAKGCKIGTVANHEYVLRMLAPSIDGNFSKRFVGGDTRISNAECAQLE